MTSPNHHSNNGSSSNNTICCGNAVSIIKGEIHNVLSVMRPQYASPLRFRMEMIPRSTTRPTIPPRKPPQQPPPRLPPQQAPSHVGSPPSTPQPQPPRSPGRAKNTNNFSPRIDKPAPPIPEGWEMFDHHPLLLSFRDLNDRLSLLQLTPPSTNTSSNLIDTLDVTTYVTPFATAISSSELSASITGAALSSLTKFILYGFVNERSTRVKDGITLIARCVRYCSFEESGSSNSMGGVARPPSLWSYPASVAGKRMSIGSTSTAASTLPPTNTTSSSSWRGGGGSGGRNYGTVADEEVVLKLLSLSALIVRCPAGCYLQSGDVVGLFDTCMFVATRPGNKASVLLKSAAGDALSSIVLVVFGRGSGADDERAVVEEEKVESGDNKVESSDTEWPSMSRSSSEASCTDNNNKIEKEEGKDSVNLLESAAEQIKQLYVESPKRSKSANTTSSSNNKPKSPPPALVTIMHRLSLLTDPNANNPNTTTSSSNNPTSPTTKREKANLATTATPTCVLALSLINIALETMSTRLNNYPALIPILQNTLCKHLLQLSTTQSPQIFTLVLRVIFNLFNSMKNHLKIQLEVFLTSVHLRVLQSVDLPHNVQSSSEDDLERNHHLQFKELALESLVEFCQEPMLMQDLYYNYDCDVQCTNLFETICKSLAVAASPPTNANNVIGHPPFANNDEKDEDFTTNPQTLNALNRLALEGILAIIDSIAKRCQTPISNTNNNNSNSKSLARQPSSSSSIGNFIFIESPPPSNNSSTPLPITPIQYLDLQNQKKKKRNLSLAASEFNKSPMDKSWINYAVSLEVLPDPPTPGSVAGFLYNTPYYLDKTQMGLYLSKGPVEKYPFHADVLREFVNLFDFREEDDGDGGGARIMDFSEALRTFLLRFRLPGEAQCIDRLMESFAKRLYEQECALVGDLLEEQRGENVEVEGGDSGYSTDVSSVSKDITLGHDQNGTATHTPTDENGIEEVIPENEPQGQFEDAPSDNEGSSVQPPSPISSPPPTTTKPPSPSTLNNKSIFKSADAIFILAFSTIMLNTDLHNPTIADDRRMTADQFVRNNRGINDGSDIPEHYLRELYRRIQAEEIQVQQELNEMSSSGGNRNVLHGIDGLWNNKDRNVAEPFFQSGSSSGGDNTKDNPNSTHFNLSQQAAGIHEKDMFTSISKFALSCIRTIFIRSSDDALVIKALGGFQQMCSICVYFELEEMWNEILGILLGYGLDYITSAHDAILMDSAAYRDDNNAYGAQNGNNVDGSGVNTDTYDSTQDDEYRHTPPVPAALFESTTSTASSSTSNEESYQTQPQQQQHHHIHSDSIYGSAAHRGLLALHCGFNLVKTQTCHVREAWPMLIECLFALRDMDALPSGLSELDDFADSRGVQFPPSLFARRSYYKTKRYMEGLLQDEDHDAATTNEEGGFWGNVTSLFAPFGGTKEHDASQQNEEHEDEFRYEEEVVGMEEEYGHDMNKMSSQSGYSLPFSEALLSVAKAAQLDQILMRSKDDAASMQIIRTLLDAMDPECLLPTNTAATMNIDNLNSKDQPPSEQQQQQGYYQPIPENDPLFEHHAVFALELAARALLSNLQRAPELFPVFHSKLEGILTMNHRSKQSNATTTTTISSGGNTDDAIADDEEEHSRGRNVTVMKTPYLMERAMVTILRACIHLFDNPTMRPYLLSSLRLLQNLPLSFIQRVADRLACGMAIILRGSYTRLQTLEEWTLLGKLLDMAAQFYPGRAIVFEGIASTIESAFPPPSPTPPPLSTNNDENPTVTTTLAPEAVAIFITILTKFVSGTYQGDVSGSIPAMTTLEKIFQHLSPDTQSVASATLLPYLVPNLTFLENTNTPIVSFEDLWKLASNAYYSQCLSTDADTARQAHETLQRHLFTTYDDHAPNTIISDGSWLFLLEKILSQPPPLSMEVERMNTCDLLGKLFLLLIPNLAQRKQNWDALTSIVHRAADCMGENLGVGRRGNGILFESTVQLVTNLSNVLTLAEFDGGGVGFSKWVGETLLVELERVGAAGGSARMIAATTKSGEDDVVVVEEKGEEKVAVEVKGDEEVES